MINPIPDPETLAARAKFIEEMDAARPAIYQAAAMLAAGVEAAGKVTPDYQLCARNAIKLHEVVGDELHRYVSAYIREYL